MKNKRIFVWQVLALFMLIGLILLPTITAGAAETPQRGGILKIIDVSEGAQPLGEPWAIMGIDVKIVKPVLETYMQEDINGKYTPFLATSWKVDTAKNTITLFLRKGVKFHDGTDFNAKAAKWNLEQSIKAQVVKGFLSVDIIDDYTIRINVDKYQNNFFNFLSSSYGGSVVSPTAFEKNGKDWAMVASCRHRALQIRELRARQQAHLREI